MMGQGFAYAIPWPKGLLLGMMLLGAGLLLAAQYGIDAYRARATVHLPVQRAPFLGLDQASKGLGADAAKDVTNTANRALDILEENDIVCGLVSKAK